MMKKNIMKKMLTSLMVFSIIFSNINVLVAKSSNLLSGQETTYNELRNLVGNYDKTANGYLIKNTGGDNHNISDIKSLAFSYETDITFVNGNNATIIFGAERKDPNNLGKFFGLEVSRNSGNNQDVFIKLFQNPLGVGLGDNVITRIKGASVVDNTQAIKIKLIVDADKNMEIYINDEKVNFTFQKDFSSAYTYGYFGMLTWNTEAKFDNLQLTTMQDENNFRTNLENLTGIQGSWQEASTGLNSSGSGDNFAISDTTINNFEFSANIKNLSKSGAGALVFRSGNNSRNASYVMNIDYSNKIFKLFSFPSGGTIKEVPLSSIAEKADGSYDLKVQAVGSTILIYVNDIGIMKVENSLYTGGKLGLLTWNGSVTYQDVVYKQLDSLPTVADPKLTAFKIEPSEVTITPQFDPKVNFYGMDIKPGINVVTITPEANGKIYVTKRDENGNVIKAKEEVTGSFTINADEFVENFMNLNITVQSSDGFTKDINFAVNKWYSNEELANQDYRAQFHVTSQTNFMNDPNGMVYDSTDGYWHLFYQYSTKNTFHNQSWAHVRSVDLVNWEQMPLGLQIDDDGLIFSGSAIEDKDNDSGLFTDNQPGESKLIAYYTIDTPNIKQQQALAYSKDHGVTWQKYGVVVLNSESISGINFRDPKVFKIEDTWYMVTAGGAAQIHTSKDLIHWQKSQALKFKDGSQINSECPMLYPAKVNGTGEEKWIYGGSAGFYVVGNMTKDATGTYKWTAESDIIHADSNENPWGGFGKYATMTFFEDGTGQNRQIGISWLMDFVDFSGRDYKGVQSLPQIYGLKQDANGKYIITSKPVEEVTSLRDMNNILYSTENKNVNASDVNILKSTSGIRYDLEGEFTIGSATQFGFKLCKGNGEELVFMYDVTSKQMKLDVSKAGQHQSSGNYSYTLIPTADNKVKLRIIIDQAAVEAFGNDDEANISTVVYTNNDNIGMEFFTNGSVKIDSLNIYDMKSMYSKKSGSELGDTKLALDAPKYVNLGDSFEVIASIYPNVESKNLEWIYDESLTKVTNDSTSSVFSPTKTGTYEIIVRTKDGSLERKVTVNVIEPKFNTNVTGWSSFSGNWEVVENGVMGTNLSTGDSFYLSDGYVEKGTPFTYVGDIHLENGQAAGLVFGITDKQNPGSNWYCANIDKVTNGGIAKIFKNVNGQAWDISQPLTPEQKNKKDYKVRIEYDGNTKISYYLDDVLIGEKDEADFKGGYLGLVTYKANASFDNVFANANAEIIEVITKIEDIHVKQDSDVNEIITKLPSQVEVKQSNGITKKVNVTWNTTTLSTAKVGSSIINGVIDGTNLTINVNLIIDKKDVDKKILEDLIKEIEGMDLTKYQDEGVKKLMDELLIAKTVFNNSNATQEEVDASIQRIKDLISNLILKEESPAITPITDDIKIDKDNKPTTSDLTKENMFVLCIALSGLIIGKLSLGKKRENVSK